MQSNLHTHFFRYVKYADELQVFGGGDESIDFVYTLVDNSSNGNITKAFDFLNRIHKIY